MRPFEDHFGAVSRRYATARPTYPEALFAWLAMVAPGHTLAWDCGAGNGQASVALGEYFDEVVATDASAAQLAEAMPHPRVTYRVAPAAVSDIADNAADIVCIAQALHWFPLDAFYAEVRRVLKPRGIVAAWTYAAFTIDHSAADAVVRAYHYGTVDAYWPPERAHVENGYRDMPFPFTPIEVPAFRMRTSWTLDQVTAYLRSWSATVRFVAAHGRDPVMDVERELRAVWGEPDRPLDVDWPLTVIAGRV